MYARWERKKKDDSELSLVDTLDDSHIRCQYCRPGTALNWDQGIGKDKIQIALLYISSIEDMSTLTLTVAMI